MFSVRETPWHRLGVVLDSAPRTAREALEIAGLDWDVECRPIYREIHQGDYLPVPDARVVVRTDRNDALAVVGKDYTPLQNRDAFRVLEPLIDSGLATFETAGSLSEGRDVWGMIRFNIDSPIVREVFTDEVIPYGLLANNHTGRRVVNLTETPVRVVCRNTLGVALQGASGHKIRHTANVEARTVEAATELWGAVIERYEGVAEQYAALKRTFLDLTMFRSLVLDIAAPEPRMRPGTNPKLAETLAAKAIEKRDALTRLWHSGTGHTGDSSAWEAYNAVTEATDHLDIFKVGNDRLGSLMYGSLGRIKQDVLDSLVTYTRTA